MTARVTTLKGPDAGVYYVEQLPNYYLDSGEPAGLWLGAGADRLGLAGDVVDAEFLNVMAGLHPRLEPGVHLGRPFRGDSVRGFDVTCSAPKSVSVLFATAQPSVRDIVLRAHDTAVAMALAWVEAHALTRHRIDGQVAVVDAHGLIAAVFRQHTSRALDPQVHSHVVIANRVLGPDGRWLALDARGLKMDQRTVSAIYHAALRSELTRSMRVEWEPVVNGIAEITRVPKMALEEFSTRTAQVQARIDTKIDRFIDTMGREPTPRERWRLEREAVTDSRPPKARGVDAADLHQVWTEQLADLDIDPDTLVRHISSRTRPRQLTDDISAQAIHDAIAVLSQKQSTWRPAELTREIAAALPANVTIEPHLVGVTLDRLTDTAIRALCVDISAPILDGVARRRDGRPVTESILDRALTTDAILTQEERLLAWAERRMTRIGVDSPHAAQRSSVALTVPQAQTAAAVAGDADLVLIVGPAGTGKTTALAPAVAQLQADGRPVLGVAPSAAAADVLGAETGVYADTIDKLLTEHSRNRPPQHHYDLPVGATVIVDEAGMAGTTQLARLASLADDKGWRVVLVGDPMQFAAVGRGGMFAHLVDTHNAIELDAVHRFTNTWEREASLRLRRGDPSVVDLYDAHERIHGGTTTRMHREALDAWWHHRLDGATVVLAAPTNDTVMALNRAAQARRINTGELDTRGRRVDTGTYLLWAGDEIVTRRNHRLLRTDRGLMIANRDRWTITTVHRNGDLTAVGNTGRVRLPADYVHQHVELAYAQTSHAAQGRTVDHSILVLDGPCDVRGVYVPMTRGRESNHAYVITDADHTATDILTDSVTRSWIDQPALARQAELAGHNRHRPGLLPPPELNGLHSEQHRLTTTLNGLDEDLKHLPRQLRDERADHARAVAALDTARNKLQTAFDTVDRYDRPLKRRRHEPELTAARHNIERLAPTVKQAAHTVDTHDRAITDFETRLAAAQALDKTRPALQTRLGDIDARLGDDHTLRARHIRRDPPQRILDLIGRRPPAGGIARHWDHAAASIDQHQTTHNLDNGLDPHPGVKLTAAFKWTRSIATADIRDLDHAIDQQQHRHQQRTIEHEGPYHGISM